jgi:hypothetical protein
MAAVAVVQVREVGSSAPPSNSAIAPPLAAMRRRELPSVAGMELLLFGAEVIRRTQLKNSCNIASP